MARYFIIHIMLQRAKTTDFDMTQLIFSEDILSLYEINLKCTTSYVQSV